MMDVPSRSPLRVTSSNIRRKAPLVTYYGNLLDKFQLPSFTLATGRHGARVDPFVAHSSCEVHYGQRTSDEFWSKYVGEFVSRKCDMERWQRELSTGDLESISYDEEYRFHGCEDYDSTALYGVDESVLLAMLDGSDLDFWAFLCAEGQFVRVMLSTSDSAVRTYAFQVWLVLVGRVCGTKAYRGAAGALDALLNLGTNGSCCPTQGSGVFRSLDRHAVVVLRSQQFWMCTLRGVSTMREHYYGDWCFDVDLCPLHGIDCCTVAATQVDWDTTRENTPSFEEI